LKKNSKVKKIYEIKFSYPGSDRHLWLLDLSGDWKKTEQNAEGPDTEKNENWKKIKDPPKKNFQNKI